MLLTVTKVDDFDNIGKVYMEKLTALQSSDKVIGDIEDILIKSGDDIDVVASKQILEKIDDGIARTGKVFDVGEYLRLKNQNIIDDISGYCLRLQRIHEFTNLTAPVTTQAGYSIVRSDLKIGTTIYRGEPDFRPEVFSDGFRPKPSNGAGSNLVDYVNGVEGKFLSTTVDSGVALSFAKSGGVMYEIEYSGLGIDVNTSMGNHYFDFEKEIAFFPNGIDSRYIKGYWNIDMKKNLTNFIPNPQYGN